MSLNLVGDEPQPSVFVAPIAAIAPSGTSVLLHFNDSSGADVNVASVSPLNEIQSISITGSPAGSAIKLSFGGQTTAPIPTGSVPPYVNATWTFPTIAGHSYVLADTHLSLTSHQYTRDVIDGNAIVARSIIDDTQPLTNTVVDPGTNGVVWSIIAPGGVPASIVASGKSLQIRVSVEVGSDISAEGIRVQDTTAGTITYYDCKSPQLQTFPSPWNTQSNIFFYDGSRVFAYRGGLGNLYQNAITGGANAVQAALASLTSIGSSSGIANVSVTDASVAGQNCCYQVTYTGSMAESSQPLLTCTDPAIQIARVNPGGNFPTLSINGGKPILLADWLWGRTGGYCPVMTCPLPQASAADPDDRCQ